MFDTSSETEPEETELLEEEPAEESEEASSSFDSFADLALDTQLPMAERRQALKEAIMACMGSDYEEESEPGDTSSLASIFGE